MIFPSDLDDPVDGLIPMPSADETSIGRHSARIVGLRDADTLVVLHAWSGWTPDQTAGLTREYFNTHARGSILNRPWNRGPLASTARRILESDDSSEIGELWRIPRVQAFEFKDMVPGRRVKLSRFVTWSLQDELPAEVLTLDVGKRIRAGVAVLVHDEGRTAVVDLFIWPPYRRQGLGTCLERFAEERAQAHGARELLGYVWEADSIRGLDRAERFLAKSGYQLERATGSEYVVLGRRDLA